MLHNPSNMEQNISTLKETLEQALAGEDNAVRFFNLGSDRDVAVNLRRETIWENLNNDYHNYAKQ